VNGYECVPSNQFHSIGLQMIHIRTHSKCHLRKIFSEAYQWRCKSRKNHPPSADIWDFRRSWETHKESVLNQFYGGKYQFDNQKKTTLSDGDRIAVWYSRDALILKVLTRIIQDNLKPFLSKSCYHLKGHGGLKGADSYRIGQYVSRWVGWTVAGLWQR